MKITCSSPALPCSSLPSNGSSLWNLAAHYAGNITITRLHNHTTARFIDRLCMTLYTRDGSTNLVQSIEILYKSNDNIDLARLVDILCKRDGTWWTCKYWMDWTWHWQLGIIAVHMHTNAWSVDRWQLTNIGSQLTTIAVHSHIVAWSINQICSIANEYTWTC